MNKSTMFPTVLILLLLFATSLTTAQAVNLYAQSASTNNTRGTVANTNTQNGAALGGKVDTFRAKGQISSLASDTLAGRPSSNTSEIWVLGGNWEFGVNKGNLSNLAIDISMSKIDGKGAHHHTIESLRNATGAVLSSASKQIALTNDNTTTFKGIADITTNGKVKWKDVPIVVHLLNGNVINFNIDPTKTDDHFKGLPVFGTVESIIGQDGKELLKK